MTDNTNAENVNTDINTDVNTNTDATNQVSDSQNSQNQSFDLNKEIDDKKVDETKTETKPDEGFVKTGEVGLDLAMDFVSGLGFKTTDPAVQLAFEGDFSLLRAELARKGDEAKGWEEFIKLAERDFKILSDRYENEQKERKEAIIKTFNGDEGLMNDVLNWTRKNADQNEKEELNKLLNGSKLSAVIASSYLKNLYQQANGTIINPANPVINNATITRGSEYALNPNQYATEVANLVRRIGSSNLNESPEYAKLQARRRAWKQ